MPRRQRGALYLRTECNNTDVYVATLSRCCDHGASSSSSRSSISPGCMPRPTARSRPASGRADGRRDVGRDQRISRLRRRRKNDVATAGDRNGDDRATATAAAAAAAVAVYQGDACPCVRLGRPSPRRRSAVSPCPARPGAAQHGAARHHGAAHKTSRHSSRALLLLLLLAGCSDVMDR